ncbi:MULTISPECIES: alpha/beta hydrolase [Pontibacillus]|uniref:Alpha/beta hydrolase n=1 Tax=Pontibacillus chungwhensis TaxID=265426 RepID=A0ABY8USW3_9BACI|nr:MULTISPECIES: alpha/beta hydrolase [Pontibacillus]MCD5322901.1 alpha/beta hydrolase [Pontibacillus sp. HN14]WIF96298.1 alpha/beta hydrolase [Pontibacillus chungwhensis]
MNEENLYTFKARDQTYLQYYFYGENSKEKPTIVFIHGITAELHHIQQFALKIKTEVNVIIPLLRGYDPTLKRGDLYYIGQYDDDLEDLEIYLREGGIHNLYWVGHSMGCGNLYRYLEKGCSKGTGIIFLSPFFHPSLPVYRFNQQSDQEEDQLFEVKFYKSIILYTLHRFKIGLLNRAKIATIPDDFHQDRKLTLSFRLLFSRFPVENNLKSLHNSKLPLFMMIGEEDEITDSSKMCDLWRDITNHPFTVEQGEDHNSIISSDNTIIKVKNWIKDIQES